ncbi:carbohydrate ABC transporter permease [Aureimonas fodinaquatilis]|uniref:Maltose/maltodextrin transport system permease protein MalG n=2 Tax=Aureimonas fodinaquatilis TaxID=2565783 RepID=A0A5B0E0M0_9HYPH|nr:carbohydrate ABC transporter permease [Aureimonas fodinaquatilis]
MVLLWSGVPIYLVVSSSFKVSRDIFAVPPKLFVFSPTLDNYTRLLAEWPQFFSGLWNSLIIAGFATVLTVIVSSTAGYVYSRHRGALLTGSAFFMIIVRLFPPIVITLPLFPWINAVHLNDTHIVLIVLYASFYVSLGTWIMKAFFDQVPRELDEAATMDGANPFQALVKILLPLGAPGMIATAVFISIFAWNEFLFAFIFTSTNARTAPMALSEMMGSVTGVDWGVLFAAASLHLVPVAIFVIAMQRFLIAGLTAGSVKG